MIFTLYKRNYYKNNHNQERINERYKQSEK